MLLNPHTHIYKQLTLVAPFLSRLVQNRQKRSLRMLLRALRARIFLHRRRPVAARSELHGQVAAQHRQTPRSVAPRAQRRVLEEGLFPQDQGRRGSRGGGQGFLWEKQGECSQEATHGLCTQCYFCLFLSCFLFPHLFIFFYSLETSSPFTHAYANAPAQGYEVTHRDIELLKLRNYTISTKIDADVFTKEDVQERLAEVIRGLCGFVSFSGSGLNSFFGLDQTNFMLKGDVPEQCHYA